MLRFVFILFVLVNAVYADLVAIPAPDFSNVVECIAGVRPYRTSGIRLESEYLNEKLVIHNYGHGGSGLSLSWGSAEIAGAIMQEEMPGAKSIAIIGSGVIGLSLAHVLLDQGYIVYIYAKEFPPHTTSDIATGTFGTYLVQGKEDPLFLQMKELSLAKLKRLATEENPEFSGVSYVDFYNLCSTEAKHLGAKMVQVQFGNREAQTAEVHPKLFMEAPLYMQELFEKAKQKGARMIQSTFTTLEEVSTLSEDVVFNCTGIGSRALCRDNDLIPIRGQLVYVEAT